MSRQERLRTDLSLDLAMINWSAVQSSQYGIGRFALPANSVFIASECGSNFANQIVYGNVYMLSDFNLAYCTWYFATGTLVLLQLRQWCKRSYASHRIVLFATGLQFVLEPAHWLQQPVPAASLPGSSRIRLATVSCIKCYWLSCRCATTGMT